MKFTCDSCGAAYMISDDKVGPSGVKVRCKKCGNVITVKRAEAAPVVVAAQPAPSAASNGFDDELGNAFDHAFGSGAGGGASSEPGAPAGTPAPGVDLQAPAAAPAPGSTPVASTPSPAAAEWYVAIGEAQVGPLPLAEVRKRWEAADIGPDSLVWRPGMGDWGPLSAVAELAAYLSPVARPAQPVAAPAAAVTAVASEPARPRASSAASAPAAMTPSPGAEITWKPSGASALAALASEELVSRQAPAAPAAPPTAASRSIMEQLPDSGGVDPTGAIPLPIKGLDQTDERPVRRSSVARGAEEARQRRGRRTLAYAAAGLLVAGGAGAGAWYTLGRPAAPPPPAPPVVAQAAPAQPVAPPPATAPQAAPAPTPAEGAQAAAATAAVTGGAAAAARTEAPPEPAPARAEEPVKAAAPAAAAVKRLPGKLPTTPKPASPGAARPAVVAAAEPPAERPAPPPAVKKKDSVLDFDQGGADDLDAALGNAGGRSVYVPPKPGGTAAPERLSDAQITESVKLHVDALRRCAAEQGTREPGAHGTLKMAWTIAADGAPRDVRCLTPDLAQGAFAQCITGVVKGIRFPRISDARGQAVTFPFGF